MNHFEEKLTENRFLRKTIFISFLELIEKIMHQRHLHNPLLFCLVIITNRRGRALLPFWEPYWYLKKYLRKHLVFDRVIIFYKSLEEYLKWDSRLPKKLLLFASMKVFSKWWKVFFISSRKPSSFSTYLNFCPDFFGHVGKRLNDKLRLISKSMRSQIGKKIVTVPILPIISRSKGIQTMKFSQLI